jgi:hypothetical protein
MKGKKSWAAKMAKPSAIELLEGPANWNARFGGDKMLIATPRLIDAIVREIPQGRTLSMGELRARLAQENGADYTCPLTTGIFFRITAEAAEEAFAEGRPGERSPWWRLIPDDQKLNPKLPGGGPLQAELLQNEGVAVYLKGKTLKVGIGG